MRRVTAWADWSIRSKVQVVFLLVGSLAPIALLLLAILPSSGPDWEGAFWPVGLLGMLLLAPGMILCKALEIGEPISISAFVADGVIYLLMGTFFGSLENAKRKRRGHDSDSR